MMQPSESYRRVQYDLRPAKQTERRMIVDALQLLAGADFQIREYQYTGMGSIFFWDFVLFHRLLGIRRLLSVEYSEKIKKRVRFNRPFGSIDVKIGHIGDVIPKLSLRRRHLLWLDYDDVIHHEILADVFAAASRLPIGSILLVTVDVGPPGRGDGSPKEWRQYFLKHADPYADPTDGPEAFARSKLPLMNALLLKRALGDGLLGRIGIEFVPMFSFLYADTHQMLTVGGMLCGDSEKARLYSSGIYDADYARDDLRAEPFRIRVPRLTRRERMYLDAAIPCAKGWVPKDFELEQSDVEAYARIYRFLPAYGELLV